MKNYRGLTLIEILVAMGILAGVVLILYSVFNISLRGWRKADNVLQAATIARVVFERISREVSAAIVDGGNNFHCRGFDKLASSGWRTASSGDEFYFIAGVNPDYSNGSDLCEVGYWLGQDSDGITVLKRFYVTDDRKVDAADPDFDFNFATGNSYEFARDISDLEFDFYDSNGNLFTSWDSRSGNGPPAKVKVTITIKAGKGSESTNPDFVSQKFSTFIALPR